MNERLTVLGLEVEDFKKIRAVRIVPKGSVVELNGRNAQGKSSILDAIEAALCGRDAIPAMPVRNGSKRATIKIDLGNLRVKREVRQDGKHTLRLESADPAQESTQAALDALLGQISFDPYAFSRLKSREQAEQLRAAMGIDTRGLDVERERTFNERTIVNREVTRLEGAIAEAYFPDGPDKPVDVGGLLRQLEGAEKTHRGAADARAKVDAVARETEMLELEIASIEKRLAETRKRVETLQAAKVQLEGDAQKILALAVDTAPIKAEIAAAAKTNEVVSARKARRDLAEQLANKAGEASKLSRRLDEIDEVKAEMLLAANFPIPNLRLDGDAIYLNGEPLEQASQAERLRFAVALGIALNPTIRVLLIRDGSLLDEDSLAMVAKMAEDAGAQVWIEKVGKGDGTGWLIEDGEVVAEGAAT